MGFTNNIGKYQLTRTIGEGTFAKVKLAVDSTNGCKVAIKVIDKKMVMESNLKYQVQREIRTMKLLHHPNIVRIHEVIGTKTKIYIVMEYVSGGQLSDKMSYLKRLTEGEARKLFQQLIDAIDYCHNKGVYHRDLKPENLLLDSNGNIKVSDFGLSALQKPGALLSTACGSPCYVAPELLGSRGYDGAAADVWSCGIILYELLAGYLPFDDSNLIKLYKKITRAECNYPNWFTQSQKKLMSRILNPSPTRRITLSEIIEDEWFKKDYVPVCGYECDDKVCLDDINKAFDSIEEKVPETNISSSFINAFRLIAMSNDLNLSGFFEEEDVHKQKMRLGSKHTFDETINKIKAAAVDVHLSIEKMNNFKLKMHSKQKPTRCCRSYTDLSAEVIEVAPTHCVIEISKSAGTLGLYEQFCKSLSSLLAENTDISTETQEKEVVSISSKSFKEKGRLTETYSTHNKDHRGYSSS